jgi:hypothetical protein
MRLNEKYYNFVQYVLSLENLNLGKVTFHIR